MDLQEWDAGQKRFVKCDFHNRLLIGNDIEFSVDTSNIHIKGFECLS